MPDQQCQLLTTSVHDDAWWRRWLWLHNYHDDDDDHGDDADDHVDRDSVDEHDDGDDGDDDEEDADDPVDNDAVDEPDDGEDDDDDDDEEEEEEDADDHVDHDSVDDHDDGDDGDDGDDDDDDDGDDDDDDDDAHDDAHDDAYHEWRCIMCTGESGHQVHQRAQIKCTGEAVTIDLRENLNRKPIGFYHQIDWAFRLKFSHHPILWDMPWEILRYDGLHYGSSAGTATTCLLEVATIAPAVRILRFLSGQVGQRFEEFSRNSLLPILWYNLI